jgi:4-amino-4-deoxy-L-arabinose transferase-like glycosyltransferase
MKITYVPILLLLIFLIAGTVFRLQGIQKNLSYWNDESNVAIYARSIANTGISRDETGYSPGVYQIGIDYLTAASFKIFGINEFAGRLPSVIAGTLLILGIFYITRKLIGENEGLIACFLVAFSQIQLAWSTQQRPYIWLELFTLFITYFCYQSIKQKNILDKNIFYAFLISVIAFLFHGTGLINILLIGVVLLYKIVKERKYIYLLSLIPLAFLVLIIMRFSFGNALPLLFKFDFNIIHYKLFLKQSYWWLILGSIIGGLSLLK